ncbi:hypothetical protein [Sunxiuqinia elliptica]|uniref:Abortive infection Abi-like protein n=1 Tax=Sunxiuqinia elliptica TaxID=655355 RepID=A0A4R6GRJ4_9BACT|nr:hypothetical protein [Sunxiuqinia elliptica]TDN97823.1 hypothetical protein DET52_109227 [Sunxiuqinia elliptica]TDO55901.1 hypothetical protein DET65_4442 [Sunxiuqinia elliptica]
MAKLKQTDKLLLESQFEMSNGYVLDFSNPSFQQFIFDTCKIDIYNSKYSTYGDSKAKRLRVFWQLETDMIVGKLTNEMLAYWRAKKKLKNEELTREEALLFNDCLAIANKLRGVSRTKKKSSESSKEDFLRKEFKSLEIDKLGIDSNVIAIIKSRLEEIRISLENNLSLSAVIMCGSVLEGILLGTATSKMKEFNQSTSSPINKETGKVKPFHEWSLSNFIDVSYNLGLIGLDVKKYSHSLRDFRNYIHPYQQMSSQFSPDINTAKISWQVLQAAIDDLINNQK